MLKVATSTGPPVRWVQQDIVEWLARAEQQFDLVFSNAALQWVGDHAVVFPSLIRRVASGGVLAVQVPADVNAPAHRIMRERFPGGEVREWFVHEPAFYYDLLSPHARRIHLWTTEYLHVLPSVAAIAGWYRSTGLRPFLEALSTDEQRDQFMHNYIEGLRQEFHPRGDGRVLFPFRRLFLIAERAYG
jgi:trans-aconitate 2-methyltransferase